MSLPTIHLRAETKPLERRAALTPTTAAELIKDGYTVHVEHSPLSIFSSADYAAIGAKLVPTGSWPTTDPSTIILGLKELPETQTFPLIHTHVQFAHCYKNQAGWDDVLSRFARGNGTLLDLEFLQDDAGRRVAAFGYHAGFAGAALSVLAWERQVSTGKVGMDGVKAFENEDVLIDEVKRALERGIQGHNGQRPRCFVMGALGRCGKGAVDLFKKIGLHDLILWDINETRERQGPYREILDSDIFVNCIYLSDPIPPFVAPESLDSESRKLSVVCDVSCDTTNPHNPIPIYKINTTFSNPVVKVDTTAGPPLSVISIDHLPSLLPREASEAFSGALLPSLLQLKDRHTAPVWARAENLFKEKLQLLPESKRAPSNTSSS